MSDKIDVAVVGADSAAGELLLELLQEFPAGEVHALAQVEANVELNLSGELGQEMEPVESFDFSRVRIAFFAGPASLSAGFAERAVQAGANVVDLGAHFRLDGDVPLVMSAINHHDIGAARERGIVACPDPATLQLVLALAPLHAAAGIERVSVTTLLPASTLGRAGVEELGRQTADLLNFRELAAAAFPRQIAFNALPDMGGETSELAREAHKILADERILIAATGVYVPVFYGQSQIVEVQTRDRISAGEARELLGKAQGVVVVDDGQGSYPTAVTDAAGRNEVFVGRIREDRSHAHGLAWWSVADALRCAVANAVEIAQELAS